MKRSAFPWALLAAALVATGLLPAASRAHAGSAHGWSRNDSGEQFWYALVSPGGESFSGSTDTDSWDDIRREVAELGHEALWLRIEGRDYLASDPSTLARARDILRPTQDLGRQQGRLGRIQSELGRRQSRIGALQSQLGARQARLSLRISRLAGRDDSDPAEQRALERELDEVTRQQEELARQQEPLAREQQRLGARQEMMGREQEKLSARAAEEMRRLAKDAIDSGLAKPAR